MKELENEQIPKKRQTKSFEELIIELPVTVAVRRGLWRSVSHSSKTIEVVEDENDSIESESSEYSEEDM